jgi:EAL domain/CHASE4 domain
LLVQANQHRDRRRTRLFGPIIAMTFGGLAMLVALSVFLIQRFDSEASKRETVMVEHGFARQLDELDAVVAPQVNWEDAILNLDHRLDADWAEFNIGNYLYTFNGFNRAFVVDGDGRPIYASVDGKQAEIGRFVPFAPVVAQLLPVIRQAETARPALGKRPGKHNILVPPIEANGRARVDGQAYVVIASLVQPDFGEYLPKGPHSPVPNVAKPIDAAMLGAFSQRYLLENLQLVEPGKIEASASIGVAIVERPGIDSSEALRWADLALYCSKDLGRARVTFFEPEMDAEQRSRRSLEADLRAALGDGSLHLVYQPQVDRAGNIAAVEALLRWTHPVRGVIPPSVFVPLAEESGLILGLGELVLRQALVET